MSFSQIPRKRRTLIEWAGVQMSRYTSLAPGIQSRIHCTSVACMQGLTSCCMSLPLIGTL